MVVVMVAVVAAGVPAAAVGRTMLCSCNWTATVMLDTQSSSSLCDEHKKASVSVGPTSRNTGVSTDACTSTHKPSSGISPL